MIDDHTFYERPRLEWVHHEFLVGVLRERDEAEPERSETADE